MARIFIIFFLLISTGRSIQAQPEMDKNLFPVSRFPVFSVNFVHPTADKPQSKLWYTEGSWWALLPDSTGPTLWQRLETGWKEYPEVNLKLRGIPGRADVWSEINRVTAVGVADSFLTVFRLNKKIIRSGFRWNPEVLGRLFPQTPGMIETATIARDSNGKWWVAATANRKVQVWVSGNDGKKWSDPFTLAEGMDEDDICTITPLRDGVGVVWSDQVRDAVLMRVHRDGNPAGVWEKEEVADSGNQTADDHLNTVLTPDGTLWIATKNSLDKAGKAQFMLRIRTEDGKWTNVPYRVLENRMMRPSRPIVTATDDNAHVFVGHGDNDRSFPYPHRSNITFALVDTSLADLMLNSHIVIAPDSSISNVVHNVTGPKFPYPAGAPWIVLAGDAEGRVYEADLRKLAEK